ncbi:hypothetical protein AGMMS49975_17780 [Clostridia bacterium]|nr:hypothetical protein AGMMS49975_17780 [Clostridia bacterium]
MLIGDRIRVCRVEQRMTQKALSAKTGIPEVTIRGYETNKFIPKIDRVEKIAKALSVSADYLRTNMVSEIVKLYKRLSKRGKNEVQDYISYLKTKPECLKGGIKSDD